MSEKKKTLFVSDIHMGAGKPWDWFSIDKESSYLINFFDYVSGRSDVKEIVLLGDIFDLWVCPHDQKPHRFEEIVEAQTKVFDAVKNMAGKVRTLYVNGNHDFRVTASNIDDAFSGKVKHIGNVYRRGNIHAEHGHMYALFNRPDPKNGGSNRLPLGYYITRLHTTLGESRKAKTNMILQGIDELFQMMGAEKLPESLLDTLRDAVKETKSIDVKEFTMGYISEDQTYETIRERYRNLYDDWREAVGFKKSFDMILSEMNRLGSVADQLCRDGVNIVVFGHSHDTKMDKDTWLVDDRIYANCGYWCGFGEKENVEDNAHFVETDGVEVVLNGFKGGKVERKEVLSI